MTRRPNTSLASSPALVGAVTVLVAVVAVFLAYNANNGLPFTPALDLRVRAENSAAMTKGSEVREGGVRIGVVRTIRTVRLASGKAGAELAVTIEGSGDDLPVDSSFTIRPRSPLGLKYLELVRGSSDRAARDGHVFGTDQTTIPVQIDDFARTFDGRTRTAVQRNLQGFGNALAGRGQSVNTAIDQLPPLLGHLAPVARNLSDRRTQPGTPVPRGRQDRPRGGAGGRHPGRPVHPHGDHLRGAVGRHRRAQGDDLALAPGVPGGHRLVPGAAPVPDRQRGAGARHAAGRPRPAPGAAADQRRDRDRHPGHTPLGALLRRPEAGAACRCASWRATPRPGSPCAG